MSKVAVSTLNASTIDILNTIRANAPEEYQSSIPAVAQETDIPSVGQAICGYPAFANYFVGALMDRIAFVQIKGLNFINEYRDLKKGRIPYGKTVEEVFVGMAKAREFSQEKAPSRELARTLPDVKAAFHTINYRVQYPVSVDIEDLRKAFLSMQGVQDLIANIVAQVYQGAEYDEYLLFKYLIIKAIAKGKMYPVAFDASTMTNAAVEFRGYSNKLKFPSTLYNAAGVHTNTRKEDQYIFMDNMFNASYDVNVLASAFNMDKAEFQGKLKLIDDFTQFDNDRFNVVRANSTQLEEVTDAELALMADVKAVLIDKEWFQIYDDLDTMTETRVNSGLYWNYNYNVWKIVSSSPFSNAIVFVDDAANTALPASVTVKIAAKDESANATVLTLEPQFTAGIKDYSYAFNTTEAMVEDLVAMHKYGAMIIPAGVSTAFTLTMSIGGAGYTAGTTVSAASDVGDTITFTKNS